MDYYVAVCTPKRSTLEPVDPQQGKTVRICRICLHVLGKRVLCEQADCPWCGHNLTVKEIVS